MTHEVFISYSSKDKNTADAVCTQLEEEDIHCWIAPRNVTPGIDYGSSLVNAIHSSKIFIIILSSGSNSSVHVMKEVERAVNCGVPIIPFRIENITLTPSMEYYLSNLHWMDALTPPLETHIQELITTIKLLLKQNIQPRTTSPLVKEIPETDVVKDQDDQRRIKNKPGVDVTISGLPAWISKNRTCALTMTLTAAFLCVILFLGAGGVGISALLPGTVPGKTSVAFATSQRDQSTPTGFAAAAPLPSEEFTPIMPSEIIEEFDSDNGFITTDEEKLYIRDGEVHWYISRDEDAQFIYRTIPPFSGNVRLVVRGQVDESNGNCLVMAGIGNAPGSGIGVTLGYYGAGCPKSDYYIGAVGASLDYQESSSCNFTGNWLWISPGAFYDASLTIRDGFASLEVPAAGLSNGNALYAGLYTTLFIGMNVNNDWPTCSGSIDSVTLTPLESSLP